MQKPQEAAAETEAQCDGGLRLKGECRIVELQFLQRVPQVRVFRAVRGVDAAEYHGLYRAVARQRLLRGVVRPRDRIADPRFADRLDRRRDITDLARPQAVHRLEAVARI